MAQGDSLVGIWNIGLLELGQDPLTSPDDQSKAGILCRARYDACRRDMLRVFPWNFAKAQAKLAKDVTAPLFTFANAFPLPADFLTIINLPDNDMAEWEIVGRSLYTDEGPPLNLLYTRDASDVTRFDPLFVTCLGLAMGSALAMPLVQDKRLRDDLDARWKEKLSTARSVSSQENSPKEWDVDLALRSRR